MAAGRVVAVEQLRDVQVTVNTLRGLMAGLVAVTRSLDKRYPDDPEVATLRVEFAGLLCEANKAKIDLDLACNDLPAPAERPGERERVRRAMWPDGKMAAAHDDSVLQEEDETTGDEDRRS